MHRVAGRIAGFTRHIPLIGALAPRNQRKTKAESDQRQVTTRPASPGWPAFEALAIAGGGRTAEPLEDLPLSTPIDVIIPVYRGLDDTLACIYSVLASPVAQPFELVVINDRTPEPELGEALDRLDSLNLITLLKNDRNLGFVGSVNRGMQRHPHRDVVLLNSDTVVYGDWLDRLKKHSTDNSIGSVTPLSNNATICSYPEFCRDNPAPLEIDYATLDDIAARENAGRTIEVPTGVGFCMLIPRPALDRFGYFDETAYGRGYGEENDFCMRVTVAGWRNLLALDIFVRHTGETSFAEDASAAQKAGLDTLTARYPEYLGLVHKHISEDPAAEARRRIDLARLRRLISDRPVTLCLSHTWGGGIQRFIDDKAEQLRKSGRALLILTPPPPDGHRLGIALNAAPALNLPNLVLNQARLLDADVLSLLRTFNIDQIEIHSLVRWPPQTLAAIPALANELSAPYNFYVHDYLAICPQVNLIDKSGVYCGERGPRQCTLCLAAKHKPSRLIHRGAAFGPLRQIGQTGITAWRTAYHELLKTAETIIAPSNDAAERIKRYFPDLLVTVKPHQEHNHYNGPSLAANYDGTGPIRVAIVGAIGDHKGSAIIVGLAKDALERNLRLEFVIIGYTNRTSEMSRLPNITITGKYDEAEIYDIIQAQQCHVALLPAVWPETYSYTFSIVTTAGLPTVVFDLGAPAERAKQCTSVALLPATAMTNPSATNDLLMSHPAMAQTPPTSI